MRGNGNWKSLRAEDDGGLWASGSGPEESEVLPPDSRGAQTDPGGASWPLAD